MTILDFIFLPPDLCNGFLDEIAPLTDTSWREISDIKVKDKNVIFLSANKESYLKDKKQFVGFNGEKSQPTSILIKNNNLHIDILIDPNHPSIINDKQLGWVAEGSSHRGRAYRGKTSAGKRGRGLHNKGKGAEKLRPSLKANLNRGK